MYNFTIYFQDNQVICMYKIHLLMHRSFCFQNNHIRDETRVSEVAYKS